VLGRSSSIQRGPAGKPCVVAAIEKNRIQNEKTKIKETGLQKFIEYKK
jgi:hypothetical protein